ncbi:MAG TPA: VWA domain-containing protein [Bryobacteraceae bacterium]|nr:VWA domain-containing protein [Bryobacteraceae bacterium]
MTGHRRCAAIVCGLLFSLAIGQDASEFTIHTNVERVLLDVSVKDSQGGFVSGLGRDNFRVVEDGTLQQITGFEAGDIPVTVGLVVDESASMAAKQTEVLTAALTFVTESNPNDEMFVVHFNENVRHGLPDEVLFTDNRQMLRRALLSGVPEGRTALYDGVVTALHQLDMGRQAKKTLVLISDGGDNVSKHKLRDVMHLAEETSATIYTIGVFDSDDPDANPGLIRRLAEISGGIAYFPERLNDVVPICRGIAKDIRNRYMLSYVPHAGSHQDIRHIRVSVSAPGHAKLIARTRTSYLYRP